jgi:hypothetical protein
MPRDERGRWVRLPRTTAIYIQARNHLISANKKAPGLYSLGLSLPGVDQTLTKGFGYAVWGFCLNGRYFKSDTGVITMSQYPITGCIRARNLSMSSDSTNMKWLCWGPFIPPLMYATPTSWHRAPQSVIVGVGAPSSAIGLR